MPFITSPRVFKEYFFIKKFHSFQIGKYTLSKMKRWPIFRPGKKSYSKIRECWVSNIDFSPSYNQAFFDSMFYKLKGALFFSFSSTQPSLKPYCMGLREIGLHFSRNTTFCLALNLIRNTMVKLSSKYSNF